MATAKDNHVREGRNIGPAQIRLPIVQGNGSGLKDPAWADNRNCPVHRWIPWVAGFSRDFVDDVLARYLHPNGNRPLVLDPFCGVGTTLVECMRRGVDSVGFEINPYASLASQVKVDAFRVDPAGLKQAIIRYQRHMLELEYGISCGDEPRLAGLRSRAPAGFRSRIPFFSESIQLRFLATVEFSDHLEDPTIRDLFRAAVGSVMIGFSNYSYEPSLGTRPGSGKPLVAEAPVAAIMVSKLTAMLEDVLVMRREMEGVLGQPEAKIHMDSFFNAGGYLSPQSVDLVVTSPPYLNNYHYVRNTRPQLWWLGLVESRAALRKVEESNIGKYWQTVRDSEPIGLSVPIPAIHKLLKTLREREPERGAYGGPGWANYVATYFNDTARITSLLSQLLKPGGHAVIVVGNSVIKGVEIKVEQLLSEIAALHGLSTDTIETLREKRVGSSLVGSGSRTRNEDKGVALYESAVVLRKPE